MEIPIGAKVQCSDGPGGRSTCVIINPVTDRITHLVVAEPSFPHLERLVPVELMSESTPQLIHLRCTYQELTRLKGFTEVEYIQNDLPYFNYNLEEFRIWPYVTPEGTIPVEIEQIPPGELGIHRGAKVRATDGRVGTVSEFLVDPVSSHITHLILREGHLWGKQDVTIPVAEIDRIEEDEVYLKLDKRSVGRLPAVPVRRRNL